MNQTQTLIILNDEQWLSLERAWEQSLPRSSERDLYDSFLVDSPGFVRDKLTELYPIHDKLKKLITRKIQEIHTLSPDAQIIPRIKLQLTEVKRLVGLESEIKRFQLYQSFYKYKQGWSDREKDKERAKQYPIASLLGPETKIRRSGENYMARCPLHDDKNPSLCLYMRTNSYCCFGCNQKGDVIDLCQKLYKFTFPEAVQYLNH